MNNKLVELITENESRFQIKINQVDMLESVLHILKHSTKYEFYKSEKESHKYTIYLYSCFTMRLDNTFQIELLKSVVKLINDRFFKCECGNWELKDGKPWKCDSCHKQLCLKCKDEYLKSNSYFGFVYCKECEEIHEKIECILKPISWNMTNEDIRLSVERLKTLTQSKIINLDNTWVLPMYDFDNKIIGYKCICHGIDGTLISFY